MCKATFDRSRLGAGDRSLQSSRTESSTLASLAPLGAADNLVGGAILAGITSIGGMAQQIPGGRTGQAGEPLSWLPLIVSALVVAHVIALVNISIPLITSWLLGGVRSVLLLQCS